MSTALKYAQRFNICIAYIGLFSEVDIIDKPLDNHCFLKVKFKMGEYSFERTRLVEKFDLMQDVILVNKEINKMVISIYREIKHMRKLSELNFMAYPKFEGTKTVKLPKMRKLKILGYDEFDI